MKPTGPGAHDADSGILVDVIDVTTKTTIKVPLHRIGVTAINPQLLQTYSSGHKPKGSGSEPAKTTLTLCELYQKGKCERKESCRHVHVDPEYLRAQREQHFEWMHSNAEAFGLLPPNKTFEIFNATIKEVRPHLPPVHAGVFG